MPLLSGTRKDIMPLRGALSAGELPMECGHHDAPGGPVVCKACCSVAYCSDACLKEGQKKHARECNEKRLIAEVSSMHVGGTNASATGEGKPQV